MENKSGNMSKRKDICGIDVICSNCYMLKKHYAKELCIKCYKNKWKREHPEEYKVSQKKYEQSDKGKLNKAKYNQTDKGKATKMKADKKFKQTIKRKVSLRKSNAKRRKFDDIPLYNNPFTDSVPVEWHHISDEFIVAIPKDLHKLYNGYGKQKHRELVMNIANQIYIEGG